MASASRNGLPPFPLAAHDAHTAPGRVLRFAHRGAPQAPTPANTLAAFETALRLGADGLESDVRLTADGVPVLVHGLGRAGGRLLRALRRAELPGHVPALTDLWERCGTNFELALDMVDPHAAEQVVAGARRYGAESRLWLTYWHLPEMAVWRRRWPGVHLVYSTMAAVPSALLRHTAARAAAAGVNALNLHRHLVGGGTATVVHAAGLRLFTWGLRHRRHAARATTLGADGIFLDDLA